MICLDLMPYSVVENKGFRKLLNVVAPRYQLPSRWHFSRTVIPQIYQDVKTKVKETLSNIEGKFVHCTSDIWTSKFSTNAYLSLTGHWIECKKSPQAIDEHKRVTALLKMEVLNEDHTAANILHHLKAVVKQCQDDVGVKFSVQCFVTDNATNMVKAMADGNYVHIRCMAHNLHLVVTAVLKECRGVTSVILIARKITGFVHRSNKAVNKLHKIQEELGLPKNTLVHDVSTRWNSSFHMLQRLLEQRRPLTTMCADMDLGGVMSHHQWELVQAIVKILQPIEEATRTVCEEVASLSSVIPCVQALKTALTNLKVDADVQALPEALKMGTTLHSLLTQRFQAVFDDSSGHYFKATLLDPRFKSLPMSLLSTSEFDKLKADVAAEVDAELQADDVSGVPEAASSSSVESETSGQKSLFWGAMHNLAKPKPKSASFGAMTSLKIVESYLAVLSTESLTSDPAVTFWSKMMQPQPALAHVAIKYLTCPPTSVSSERIFSTAGDIVSPHRSRLLPHMWRSLCSQNTTWRNLTESMFAEEILVKQVKVMVNIKHKNKLQKI